MSLPVRFRMEAERDLENAAAWYEEQRPGLGHAFLDEVSRSLRRIVDNAGLYPLIHRNTRRALIRRFPFGIYYRLQTNCVIVIAVLHGSRDPRRWKRRT